MQSVQCNKYWYTHMHACTPYYTIHHILYPIHYTLYPIPYTIYHIPYTNHTYRTVQYPTVPCPVPYHTMTLTYTWRYTHVCLHWIALQDADLPTDETQLYFACCYPTLWSFGINHMSRWFQPSPALAVGPAQAETLAGNSTDLNTEMPDLSFNVAGMAGGNETFLCRTGRT